MTQIANKVTGASFSRGSSKQDYATPSDLRAAIVEKFGFPCFDLAADETNFFGPSNRFYTEEVDALAQDWSSISARIVDKGTLFLNPPFGNIEPWAKKCHEEALKGARILFLVPASVGSVWYSKHVHGTATHVFFLSPRVCFDGKGPFPKDIILACYGLDSSNSTTAYHCWRWK